MGKINKYIGGGGGEKIEMAIKRKGSSSSSAMPGVWPRFRLI